MTYNNYQLDSYKEKSIYSFDFILNYNTLLIIIISILLILIFTLYKINNKINTFIDNNEYLIIKAQLKILNEDTIIVNDKNINLYNKINELSSLINKEHSIFNEQIKILTTKITELDNKVLENTQLINNIIVKVNNCSKNMNKENENIYKEINKLKEISFEDILKLDINEQRQIVSKLLTKEFNLERIKELGKKLFENEIKKYLDIFDIFISQPSQPNQREKYTQTINTSISQETQNIFLKIINEKNVINNILKQEPQIQHNLIHCILLSTGLFNCTRFNTQKIFEWWQITPKFEDTIRYSSITGKFIAQYQWRASDYMISN